MSDPTPESSLPYPPIHKDKKFVVLSDWSVLIYPSGFWELDGPPNFSCRDGTITTDDSNDCVIYSFILHVALY